MSNQVLEDRRPRRGRLLGFAVLLVGVSWGLGAFAAFPWRASDPGAAVLRVAFKHVAAFEQAGPVRSQEELDRLPRHMRPVNAERARTGKRVDTVLRVALDERPLLEKTYSPSGFRHDGPTLGYEEIAVPPGRHRVEAGLADRRGARAGEAAQGRWRITQEVDIRPGQALLIEFSEDGGLRIR